VREVHAVLAGKGWIGKTLVASLLAQYLREVDRPLVCLDTDPVNRSLVGFAALDAKPIELLMKDQHNIRGVDQLIESVLTENTNFVIDHSEPLARVAAMDMEGNAG
jgi:CO dehydrogenase nickel-insertion accessory protein CooC1